MVDQQIPVGQADLIAGLTNNLKHFMINGIT